MLPMPPFSAPTLCQLCGDIDHEKKKNTAHGGVILHRRIRYVQCSALGGLIVVMRTDGGPQKTMHSSVFAHSYVWF